MPTQIKQIYISPSGNITITQAVLNADGSPSYGIDGLAVTSASSGWEVEFVGINPDVNSEGKAIFKKKNYSGGVSSYEVKSSDLSSTNPQQKVVCTVNGTAAEKVYEIYDNYIQI